MTDLETNSIFTGKPQSSEGRSAVEMAAYDLLDELDISYTRVDHPPAMTIADCENADRLLKISIAKNLFLCNSGKSMFYLLIMPGEKPFKTKFLSKALGIARLSFAPAEFMEEYLGVTPGSVTILGLMNDKANKVQLIIDRDILRHELFGCHPCANTSSIGVKTADIMAKFLPRVKHEPILVDLPDAAEIPE